jgi:hypothetical protein
VYGTQYIYIIGGVITMGVIMNSAYLPVFHDLQLTSAYEVNLTLYYFATRNIRNILSFRTLKSGLTINLTLISPSNISVNSKIMFAIRPTNTQGSSGFFVNTNQNFLNNWTHGTGHNLHIPTTQNLAWVAYQVFNPLRMTTMC